MSQIPSGTPTGTPTPTPTNPPLAAGDVDAAFTAAGIDSVTIVPLIASTVALLNGLLAGGITPQQFAAVAASQVQAATVAAQAQAAQYNAQIAALQAKLAALPAVPPAPTPTPTPTPTGS